MNCSLHGLRRQGIVAALLLGSASTPVLADSDNPAAVCIDSSEYHECPNDPSTYSCLPRKCKKDAECDTGSICSDIKLCSTKVECKNWDDAGTGGTMTSLDGECEDSSDCGGDGKCEAVRVCVLKKKSDGCAVQSPRSGTRYVFASMTALAAGLLIARRRRTPHS